MKLSYSVLDRNGHEWKKRFSSVLMERALVDPLDKIFEQPQYTEKINVEGYVPKRGRGFFTDKPGLYDVHTLLAKNERSKNERLVLITFDDFLGRVEVPLPKEEFERYKGGPIEVRLKIPPVSVRNRLFNGKHIFSRNVKISRSHEEKPELIVYSGGSTIRETNSSVVSFARPTPLNILNVYPFSLAWNRFYASIITHELADPLLKEDCGENGRCVKKTNGRNFGGECKRKLEETYL